MIFIVLQEGNLRILAGQLTLLQTASAGRREQLEHHAWLVDKYIDFI